MDSEKAFFNLLRVGPLCVVLVNLRIFIRSIVNYFPELERRDSADFEEQQQLQKLQRKKSEEILEEIIREEMEQEIESERKFEKKETEKEEVKQPETYKVNFRNFTC